MNKIIEVRPIEVKKWHEKTGADSFTRPKKIQALVDSNTMKYATGLTEKEVVDLEKVTGYKLNDHFDIKEQHIFWDGPMGVIKLENNTMFFDISQPLKFIHYKVMKASKYVANSPAAYEAGEFPEATHVIYDEGEQIELKASKIQLKNKAIIELDKLSPDRKRELVLIMRGKDLKGNSDAFLVPALEEIVNTDAALLLELMSSDKKTLSTRALVLEALQKGILRKDGHKIYHMDTHIGGEVEDVVDYLMQDINQDFKMILMSKLQN